MDPLEYLYGLKRFGMKLGIDTMQKLVEALDNPQMSYRVVHVAGTNGKGSVCAMIASVLNAEGIECGMYTSPHLERFNERIRVNGEEISDSELSDLTERVKAAADSVSLEPTFFEFTTAMALEHFRDRGVEIAVLEVGLGGRLDATNIVNPDVSIITNVGMDHMEHLGETLEKIASEKAGIIKRNVPLVTPYPELFRESCDKRGAPIVDASSLVRIVGSENSITGQKLSVKGPFEGDMVLPLLGRHQIENLQTALAALATLQILPDKVREGIAACKWPGRLEVVRMKPLVLADGAHNSHGMEALAEFLRDVPRKSVLVISLSKGRDHEEIMRMMAPLFKHVICTEGRYKPIPSEDLVECAVNARAMPEPKKAVRKALDMAKSEECIVIAGSLYMLADAISAARNLPIPRTAD